MPTTELAKAYDPREAQKRWLPYWLERGFYHSEPHPQRTPYSIVIPPPNVTGALHMGHALNNTLQDVLIRWRRMQGYNTLWMPGTDHAGIATQAVVERLVYQTEKKTRHDLGREEMVRRIWQWKDQYEARILRQLREMGCSADWQRTRFTLDPICAKAVRQTFFAMFRDGYIYRGKRLVNWDAQLQTSVADDETYVEDTKGSFWTFQYPLKDRPGEFIRFSTTRPETMLGDVAVCVHPSDERYRHLIGLMVTIPLNGRQIPIIADGLLAKPELGTGCVKVTPAHDHNDYQCGLRNQLPMINILNPDGTINENGGKYQGMDRYKAREAVVRDMEALGCYLGREDRIIPLAYSDRSKTPIEPFLSDQWFVRMGDRSDGKPGLAQMAIDAVTSGRVQFFPERYAKTYLDWLSEKRDWCISRQLWWGHRIPVWRKRIADSERDAHHPLAQVLQLPAPGTSPANAGNVGNAANAGNQSGSLLRGEFRSFVADQCRTLPEDNAVEVLLCVAPGHEDFEQTIEALGFEQDPDVLDTWFSSALWPHSTFGWPDDTPELRYYYPTSTLVTSRDIITLWVARMVLTGLYNLGEVPFRHVYITPKILDGFGETMSKSKGNGVDPLDIIERYGADALRFQMASVAGDTQDTRLPVANICPACEELIPLKPEHLSMRTRKIVCPKCQKPFRPGGPWPTEDPELPTAKQGSERFEVGRNFANKLWNAARFLMLNLEGYTPASLSAAELPLEDRWILSRTTTTVEQVTQALETYKFSDATRLIYDFTWSEFCDWYIEMSKPRLKDPASRPLVQRVLIGVLDVILKLVQPIMPFVAESIWHLLNESAPRRGLPEPLEAVESVVIAPWPTLEPQWKDAAMERRFTRLQELVRGVREIRNNYRLDAKTMLDVCVRCSDEVAADFRALAGFVQTLGGVGRLECGTNVTKPPQAAGQIHADFEAYVSLQGLIDVAAELKRLDKLLADKRKQLQNVQGKLANASFVERAPAEVVAQQRELVADLQKQIQAIEENLRDLQTG